jgi:hypothetical protein
MDISSMNRALYLGLDVRDAIRLVLGACLVAHRQAVQLGARGLCGAIDGCGGQVWGRCGQV